MLRGSILAATVAVFAVPVLNSSALSRIEA